MLLLQDGKPDLSFFAADCFHFSRKGYAEMAMALWNNMVSGYKADPHVLGVGVPTKGHEKSVQNKTVSISILFLANKRRTTELEILLSLHCLGTQPKAI